MKGGKLKVGGGLVSAFSGKRQKGCTANGGVAAFLKRPARPIQIYKRRGPWCDQADTKKEHGILRGGGLTGRRSGEN